MDTLSDSTAGSTVMKPIYRRPLALALTPHVELEDSPVEVAVIVSSNASHPHTSSSAIA